MSIQNRRAKFDYDIKEEYIAGIVLESNEVDIRYLGKNILRSETAPIVVSAIIQNQFGKINK